MIAAAETIAFTGEFDCLCGNFGLQIVENIEPDIAHWSEKERAANLGARGASKRGRACVHFRQIRSWPRSLSEPR